MRSQSIVAVGAVLALLALAACKPPFATVTATTESKPTSNTTTNTTTNTNGGTFTVLAQLNGRIVDDLGQPISGATVTYDAPEIQTSKTARAVTNVTSDGGGYFQVANLQTGTYQFTVIPATTTTSGVTTVNNMAATFMVTVPSLTALSGGVTNSSNRTAVYSQTLYLPRLLGSISGVLYQNPTTSNATLVPVPQDTVLTMPFTGSNFTNLTVNDGINLPSGSSSTGGVTAIGLLYPEYNAATNAVTTSYFTTTKASASGNFSFTKLPLILYGGEGTFVGGTGDLIQVDLGKGAQVNSTTGNLAYFDFPSTIALGRNGSTPSITVSDTLTLGATPYPPLALVSTSTTDQNGNTSNNPATAAPIVLTFNNPIVATLPNSPLKDSSGAAVLATVTNTSTASPTLVPATVTGPTTSTPSTTVTITPSDALAPNSTYRVDYSVLDGKTKTVSTPLTGSLTFSTLNSSTAPVAVTDLAIDTSFGKPSSFNSNTSSFAVKFTYNSSYTYTAQYAVTPATTGVQGPWANAAISAPLVSSSGNTAYATISGVGTWNSGDTLSLRLVESFNGTTAVGTSGTSVSNTLTITDTVAPTTYSLNKLTTSDYDVKGASSNTTEVGFGNSFAINSMQQGTNYVIGTVGMTNFIALGASTNTTGTTFSYNGTSTAAGTVYVDVAASALTSSQQYMIMSVGNTNFSGASSNTIGTVFKPDSLLTGTGFAAATVAATSMQAGETYTIADTAPPPGVPGTNTDFTLYGAPNNTPGTTFVATKQGTGGGTVVPAASAATITSGHTYTIATVGSTNFVALGAASNTAPSFAASPPTATTFTATANGGDGTVIGTSVVRNLFTINLPNSEVMTVPKVVFNSSGTTTSASGATITVQLNTNPTNPIVPLNTLATVTVEIPAGKTVTGDTLLITLKDGAGNQYQGTGPGGAIAQKIE